MTDNEIIKYLEHAMYSAKGEDGFAKIYWERLKAILDLIKRKDAEIDKLKWDINWYKDKMHHLGEMLEGK